MSHFDQVANEWDSPEKIKLISLTSEKMQQVLSPKSGLAIMDFGCGTGLLSESFVEKSRHFVGLDTSKGMLAVFDQKFKGLPQVESLCLNLEVENLERKFDLIISSMAFHHLSCPDKVLGKMKNMLTSEGKIAIVDLDKEDGSFHPDNEAMGVKHFGFSEQELLKWHEQLGFSSMHHQIIHSVAKNERQYPLFLAVFDR